MVKYTPLECSSLSSLICKPVVFFPIYSSSEFMWAVVHYYMVHIFPWRSIILWTKRRPGSRTRSPCLTYGLMAWDQAYKSYLEKLLKLENDLFALFRPSIFLSEISIQIPYLLTPVLQKKKIGVKNFGSMVQSICDCSAVQLRFKRVLSCRACFSLRNNPPFCFVLM